MKRQSHENPQRVIAHFDLDCFYVQVEQRKRMELLGKPTAVVQYNKWKGGGIIAVGYEARKYGVTRQMRGEEAKKLCPDIRLIEVPVSNGKANLTCYRNAGSEVIDILQEEGVCERASIDEAYVDLTEAAIAKLKTILSTFLTMDNSSRKNQNLNDCKERRVQGEKEEGEGDGDGDGDGEEEGSEKEKEVFGVDGDGDKGDEAFSLVFKSEDLSMFSKSHYDYSTINPEYIEYSKYNEYAKMNAAKDGDDDDHGGGGDGDGNWYDGDDGNDGNDGNDSDDGNDGDDGDDGDDSDDGNDGDFSFSPRTTHQQSFSENNIRSIFDLNESNVYKRFIKNNNNDECNANCINNDGKDLNNSDHSDHVSHGHNKKNSDETHENVHLNININNNANNNKNKNHVKGLKTNFFEFEMDSDVLKTKVYGLNLENERQTKEWILSSIFSSFENALNNEKNMNDFFFSEENLLASAALITAKIRKKILLKTKFTCSAGIGKNKLLSKIVSGLHKPSQQTIIYSPFVNLLFQNLPISKMNQLGGKLGDEIISKFKFKHVAELQNIPRSDLHTFFGFNKGEWIYSAVRGEDNSPVMNRILPNSISEAKTFNSFNALTDMQQVRHWVHQLCKQLKIRIDEELEENNRKFLLLTASLTINFGKSMNAHHSSKNGSKSANLRYDLEHLMEDTISLLNQIKSKFIIHSCYSDPKWAITNLRICTSKFVSIPPECTTLETFFSINSHTSLTVQSTSTHSTSPSSSVPFTKNASLKFNTSSYSSLSLSSSSSSSLSPSASSFVCSSSSLSSSLSPLFSSSVSSFSSSSSSSPSSSSSLSPPPSSFPFSSSSSSSFFSSCPTSIIPNSPCTLNHQHIIHGKENDNDMNKQKRKHIFQNKRGRSQGKKKKKKGDASMKCNNLIKYFGQSQHSNEVNDKNKEGKNNAVNTITTASAAGADDNGDDGDDDDDDDDGDGDGVNVDVNIDKGDDLNINQDGDFGFCKSDSECGVEDRAKGERKGEGEGEGEGESKSKSENECGENSNDIDNAYDSINSIHSIVPSTSINRDQSMAFALSYSNQVKTVSSSNRMKESNNSLDFAKQPFHSPINQRSNEQRSEPSLISNRPFDSSNLESSQNQVEFNILSNKNPTVPIRSIDGQSKDRVNDLPNKMTGSKSKSKDLLTFQSVYDVKDIDMNIYSQLPRDLQTELRLTLGIKETVSDKNLFFYFKPRK